MAGKKRSEGQVVIALPMKKELRDLVDQARDCDRVHWIRRQMVAGLQAAGYDVRMKLAARPDRGVKRKDE